MHDSVLLYVTTCIFWQNKFGQLWRKLISSYPKYTILSNNVTHACMYLNASFCVQTSFSSAWLRINYKITVMLGLIIRMHGRIMHARWGRLRFPMREYANFDPRATKTPSLIDMKLGTVNYVGDISICDKFFLIRRLFERCSFYSMI